MRTRVLVAALVAVLALVAASSASAWKNRSDLKVAAAATARFHDLDTAIQSGYGLFTDANGVACIDMPGKGAMGVHYANGTLFADPALDVAHPEALVYELRPYGRLKLAALEYVVLKDAWDATHSSPPVLFGQQFNFTDAGNRFGLPPYYSLHVWIWKYNPAGMFEMWNPKVVCPAP
jgi:hypothetical protein